MSIDGRVGADPRDSLDIVIVSGSYGAGHDAAASALALQLRAAGHRVRRLDIAEELPWRLGRLAKWLYFAQLRLLPSTWGTTVSCLEHDGAAARGVRGALGFLGRRLADRVSSSQLVISTHHFASQALGEARARGRLSVPVVTYLTDLSVHRLWVHPRVDLHLAIHEVAAVQARRLGGLAHVVTPAVTAVRTPTDSSWRPPWPTGTAAALVVGGSAGIGSLEATARDVLETGVMTPVVACGTNERLRRRLDAVPGVVALGWRDDLVALVASARCVIQNAGGMTSLEALAAGTPTLTYRAIPGHGVTNAEALVAAGLAVWPQDVHELATALGDVLTALPLSAGARAGREHDPEGPAAPTVVEVLGGAGLLGQPDRVPVAA